MHFTFKNKIICFFFIISFLLSGCGSELSEIKKIEKSFTLIDQDSTKVIFPGEYKGKIIVAGFIFTNCPDICPMTIHNMQLIQKEAGKQGIEALEFAAISFDPLRDTPPVLKGQAELRSIDTKNYHFLTGEKNEMDSLLSVMSVFAFANDTTYTESGEPVYFFVHTDRITLIDQKGVIRNEYKGSVVSADEVINDIKKLKD
jgi:protein SCO1